MMPDCSRLQNMLKKEEQGFKEWHELAAQVKPPITEREMVTMFIDTLPAPYYDKVVGNVVSNFADLVVVGKRIELGIRRRKFSQTSSNAGFAKKPMSKKKKGETNVVLVELIFPQGKANASLYPTQAHKRIVASTNPPLVPYIPPYQLRTEAGIVASSKPPRQSIRSYDPNARCDYHGGAVGHATKRCWSLKHKVQDLLDGGLLDFQD
ncbi:hypothetical protein CR513_51228, partial [Mucuna pruriens]